MTTPEALYLGWLVGILSAVAILGLIKRATE